jgi:Ser/Thr protein kinase RdoA (MazF antagonist)
MIHAMITFEQLSMRGKTRRLRPLAASALKAYDLEIRNLRLVGAFTNTLFRAYTPAGPSYLVRICAPGWRSETDLLSEVAWLQALSQAPEIGAPLPLAARSGAYIVQAAAPGVMPCRVMLMSWLPGVLLGRRLTEANLWKMGELFAHLHAQALTFHSPPGFTRRRMDSVYARGEDEVLFDASCEDAFSPTNRALYERTRQAVNAAFARLYADSRGLRVIHNDLHHDNIKVYRGRLQPFDFEDTIWGYPVQDIAMALHDLWLEVEQETYDTLLAAFRRGYESLSPWPEQSPGQIDTFRAGRMLWVSNYVASAEREDLAGFVERVAKRFEGFLESGQIMK